MNNTDTTQAANPLDGITAAIESAIQQAREQAGTIIENARAEAEQIVADARAEAEQIIADAEAQANTRARADMERASLAIQEHAAALHTIALGLTGHETTPHDNADAASGGADDDNAGSSDADTGTNTDTNETDTANNTSPNNANTRSTNAIPPAPTATNPNNAPTTISRANAPTTRRTNGTTRKLAPWETPEEPQSETAPEPEETLASTAQDVATPQWDAPLIIDAPLQL